MPVCALVRREEKLVRHDLRPQVLVPEGKVQTFPEAVAISSESIARTLFTMCWAGELDIVRLSMESKILVTKPTSHEHCLSEPVKQLQGAIDELLGSTPDLFADQFPYFSSADWVKSLATEDAYVLFEFSNTGGNIHCNRRMADMFFSSEELLEVAEACHLTPFHAMCLFLAPEDVASFFETMTYAVFVGGSKPREDGVDVKVKVRGGDRFVPCEVVVRAHSIRGQREGIVLLQLRELPEDVLLELDRGSRRVVKSL